MNIPVICKYFYDLLINELKYGFININYTHELSLSAHQSINVATHLKLFYRFDLSKQEQVFQQNADALLKINFL